ncbi:MAG TPA: ABC transporter substrate-binding protein [Methylomirabilota bacterium]
MNRRAFLSALTGSLVTAQLAAQAQQAGKVHRMGILGNVPLSDSEGARVWGALMEGLRELGYVEGQNLVIEHLSTEGRPERLPSLASQLVRWKPDVIVVPSNLNALAARQVTRTIPIVAANLAEGSGAIASLARPGGNVTGITLFAPEIAGKQLELLKEIAPHLSRVAILWNPDTSSQSGQLYLDQAQSAAQKLGIQLRVVEARQPKDIESVFTAMRRERAGGLLVGADAMFILQRTQIADRAAKAHLPAIYTLREQMGAGGLAFYGSSMADNFRRAASYVDRILKGASPADLPVERPTKFELIINLKTAKALGLTIPPSLLQRADQVIE